MITKKDEAATKAYLKTTEPRDVAYGHVIGSNPDIHPGPYRLLPVLGWLRREKGSVYLALSCLMLRVFDDKHMGTMGWNLPLNERTEKAVCGVLTSLGWDGRIWPTDPGWPDGLKDATGLKVLLVESKLFASFVFPPVDQGSRVLRITVLKSNTDFPLSPEVPADDFVVPTEAQLEKLRALAADTSVFVK